MSFVLHRNLLRTPPMARESMLNHFVEDQSGAGVLDISSGAGVTGLGHSCASVKHAIRKQSEIMPYAHSAQWTTESVEEAGEAVVSRCGAPFMKGAATFYSGGGEAIEAAIKIAMQLIAGTRTDVHAPVLVGRRHSYHGATIGALFAGDHPRRDRMKMQHTFRADMMRVETYAPHLFSPTLNEEERAAHETASLRSLERVLVRAREHDASCIVIIEPIGGTTLGISPSTATYLAGVRNLCSIHNAVLIYDEVLSGNYRTGEFLSWQYYQKQIEQPVYPDIVVMGKGIACGYFPVSCVAVSSRSLEGLKRQGEGLWHTSTNQNHPIGCAAVAAALPMYDQALQMIDRLAIKIRTEVMPALIDSMIVTSVQGEGCLWGVCFNPNLQGLHTYIKEALRREGITAYTDGGTIEGKGNMLMFAPPFTISDADLAHFVTVMQRMKIKR